MKDNKKNYIFIDTNIYFKMKGKDTLKKLKDIANNYNILIPSIQIHEIQEKLSQKYINNNVFEASLNDIKNKYKEDNWYIDEIKKRIKRYY